MFWEHLPSSTNIASDWLSSPVDDEERKKIHMDDASVSILYSLRRELPYLLTCGRRSLVSGIQNDTVVS